MLLKQLILKDFRNFDEGNFQFNPFLTIIIGENAKGKTNLLEAIYFIAFGVGFRESREEELVRLDKISCHVEGIFSVGDQNFSFEIRIKTGGAVEKTFTINRTKKKFFAYQEEVTKAVLFSPQQIELMTGSPEVRRKYFDRFLSSGDLEYKKRLTNYENALRKRNKVLETYRNDEQLKEELAFWNTYLEEQAIYVAGRRDAYCEFLNKNKKIDNKEFSIKYLKNELTKDKLKEMFEVEKRYRRTLIGPQKDDFAIYEETDHISKNLHHFGSRSEQRLGVFWLKLNEIGYLEKIFGKRPILLLDDIFSELDAKNKKLILDLIKKHQTVVTTTEIELLDLVNVPKSIIKL